MEPAVDLGRDEVLQLVGVGLDGIGERMTRFFLETWDAPDAPFVALLRSVTTNEQAAEMPRLLAREVSDAPSHRSRLDLPQLRPRSPPVTWCRA